MNFFLKLKHLILAFMSLKSDEDEKCIKRTLSSFSLLFLTMRRHIHTLTLYCVNAPDFKMLKYEVHNIV